MKKDYRLIDLNVWMGTKFELLIDFLEREKDQTDIFCFQEVTHTTTDRQETRGVRANLLQDLQKVLDGFENYFVYASEGYDLRGKVDFPFGFGQVIFWRKDFNVFSKQYLFVNRENSKDVLMHEDWWESPRNVLVADFWEDQQAFRVANVHGIWEPGFKHDSPKRIKQSRKLIKVFDDTVPTILVGDLNLDIENGSLRMIEEGRKNLIREFGIKSTRSSIYKWDGKFADYAIVTKDIKVKSFRVLTDEVSDHLPLELIFSV